MEIIHLLAGQQGFANIYSTLLWMEDSLGKRFQALKIGQEKFEKTTVQKFKTRKVFRMSSQCLLQKTIWKIHAKKWC